MASYNCGCDNVLPSEFYQIERNITDINNHPPKPGNNGYWQIWNTNKRQYEESDVKLPNGTLPEVTPDMNGWYLTTDGNIIYWGQKEYVFVQTTASDEWVIEHKMGKTPAVTIVDDDGKMIMGDIIYVDANNVLIKFSEAVSGSAYLN